MKQKTKNSQTQNRPTLCESGPKNWPAPKAAPKNRTSFIIRPYKFGPHLVWTYYGPSLSSVDPNSM